MPTNTMLPGPVFQDLLLFSFTFFISVTPSSQSAQTHCRFIQEDSNSHSFDYVITSYSNTGNAKQCASQCLKSDLCGGFYQDSNSHVCYLTTGTLISTPDEMFNLPGIVMYRNKNARICPTSDGFREKIINNKLFCFLFVDIRRTYEDARQQCVDYGADLFHFDDDWEKFYRLEEIVHMWTTGTTTFWVGLHSPESYSDRWYWQYTGTPLTSQEMDSIPWEASSLQQRTACAKADMKVYTIDDEPCGKAEEYLCEFMM